MEVTLMLVITIFAVNVYMHQPVLDSFLFSLALAVGLTPQLLPAIISINLAHGAKEMAREKVIVKRLASIENFGSMNVLCSDKTGTLTEGLVRLHSAVNVDGESNEKVLRYAYINAFYESGFVNPIDEAIRAYRQFDLSRSPEARRSTLRVCAQTIEYPGRNWNGHLMVTKGALRNILEVCSSAEAANGQVVGIASVQEQIERHFQDFSSSGFRTLGLLTETAIRIQHQSGPRNG